MNLRRVDQLLSSLGYCSRKDAQSWCEAGRLWVGAERVRASDRVDPASVHLDGAPLDHPLGVLVALHKPVGYVCSHDARDGRLVYELLPPQWTRRTPPVTSVGRLDKETSGLVLMTDLGELVHRLTSPKHHVEKTYETTVDADIEPSHIEAFAHGLRLDGEASPTLPATLRPTGPRRAEVTLVEGRYHQVRRMFAACGLHVMTLHRTRFGHWTLAGLAEGTWRPEALPGRA